MSQDQNQLERYEKRAPGWETRCLTCGLSEPFGKYGYRLGGAGTDYRLHWCPRCQRYRCHRIQRRRDRKNRAEGEGTKNAG